ncbi:MAG TPA: transglutaminase family protein [Ohtaekwangia sp.]
MSKFKIIHITRYQYQNTVRDSANQILLYPVKDNYQEVLNHTITVTGDPFIEIHQDYFGNEVGTFTQARPHIELTIDSRLTVETTSRPLPDDKAPIEEQWKELEGKRYQMQFIDFLKQERFEALPEVQQLIEDERCKNCTPLQSARHFSEYIYKNFTYRKGITTIETTLDEIWKLKSGVCQDFAHMLLAMLRAMNIPARYVSGYICPNKNGMRGEGATHAWVEAYVPFYGWLGLDPTNNCLANETHVKLAVGKNFSDCSPVKGTYRGTSDHTLDVTVKVSYEDGPIADEEQEVNTVQQPATTTSVYKNSFRRFQEMQMQQ